MDEGISWALVLDSIKRKLFQIFVIIVIGFAITFVLSDRIILQITNDLLPKELLNQGVSIDPCLARISLISTSPVEVVMVKLQISLIAGIALALPFTAYWIMQRLKRRYEINMISLGIWGVAALILLEIGFSLTYFVILPQAYKILILFTTGADIIPLFSISQFMFFTVISLFLFSLSFEFPLIVTWLSIRGMVTVETLKERRKHVYVLIVFVAAIVTADPTPVSQMLLSVPLIFLYEVSIVISSIIRKRQR